MNNLRRLSGAVFVPRLCSESGFPPVVGIPQRASQAGQIEEMTP